MAKTEEPEPFWQHHQAAIRNRSEPVFTWIPQRDAEWLAEKPRRQTCGVCEATVDRGGTGEDASDRQIVGVAHRERCGVADFAAAAAPPIAMHEHIVRLRRRI